MINFFAVSWVGFSSMIILSMRRKHLKCPSNGRIYFLPSPGPTKKRQCHFRFIFVPEIILRRLGTMHSTPKLSSPTD